MVRCCHLAASLCTSYWCLVDVSARCHLHLCFWVYRTLWLYENLFWAFLHDVRPISLHDTCGKEYKKKKKLTRIPKHAGNYILLILFSCSYAPKASFAIGMLAFILKSVRNPNLTVSQPFTVLPALLFHQSTAKALKRKNNIRKLLIWARVEKMESDYRPLP